MPQFNPFPVGYQPYNAYNGGYPYQYQAQQIPVNNWTSNQMTQQNPPIQQDMTPVIHMDIKQIENIESISKNPPAIGTTGAYMTKDEKTIIFRSVYANGEFTDKIYEERPPAPAKPAFDPKEYVRRDELDERVNEIISAQIAQISRQQKPIPTQQQPKHIPKKEANE